MSVGEIITYIMLGFAVISGIDRAFGSKLGIGKGFERGFESMGALVMAMVGPMVVAPLISKYLAPVLTPFFASLGIDPSMIAGLLMANDAGGWPLATALAQDELIGKFTGSVVSSIMGCTIAGAFPMCFSLTPKDKRSLVAKGLSIGFITIPVGCFVGGLCFGLDLGVLLLNIWPYLLFSALFIFGLNFFEKVTIKIVMVFGYVMTAFVILCLVLAMVIKIVQIDAPDLTSFDECITVIGNIAIFLCGAFTMLHLLERFFGKYFSKLGAKMGLEEVSFLGLITTAVNAIPMFATTNSMSDRGVIVNMAFLVPASYMLGDHLAFQAAVDTSTVVPTIIAKLVAGVLAVVLALWFTKPKQDSSKAVAKQ